MFYCSNNVEYDLNFKSNSNNNNTKYLIYLCDSTCSGYADRVKGMLTAYAISLLTNRKFIIQNKMTRNCPLETFQLPNKINWLLSLNKQEIKKLSKHQIPDDFNGDLENNNFIKRNFIEYQILGGLEFIISVLKNAFTTEQFEPLKNDALALIVDKFLHSMFISVMLKQDTFDTFNCEILMLLHN